MPVTKTFIIGTFSVPSIWIALITAFVIAYSAVRARFGKQIADLFGDAIFYLLIVWKLSVILTDFSTVIKSPLSIIYFDGGLVGFYFGLVAAIGRIFIEMKRKKFTITNIAALFTGVVIVQAVYQIMMVFLNEGGFVNQLVTVAMFTTFLLFLWVNIEKSVVWPFQLVLMFVSIHLFVAAFQVGGLTGAPFTVTVGLGIYFACILFSWRETEGQV
ncbi:hypothetical protein [Sporosarcina sp. G11-34]|uniref:hypothetical protein n=1 Tax=Sporosarcina sp. G11-34 TaxID=2849605 RepID=UPI0022A92913|nr:hypothetical protein [Sporosarcina sp. G11-34]MCZ2259023.1 hypothetical protein [Sporosarcina sp. G11-34]